MCYLWCLLLLVNISLAVSDTTKKASDSKDVKFKTSFPYDQYSGGAYDSPLLGGFYGGSSPYDQYPQYGSPVSYPSFVTPQQSYNPYPYNNFNSYQPFQSYQSLPVNYYPQYSPDTYASQYPTQWQPFGYPSSSYPASSPTIGNIGTIPSYPAPSSPIGNVGTTDLVKLLSGSNVYPVATLNKTSKVTVPQITDQKISTMYIPETNFGGIGSNIGMPYGNMPFNPYSVNTQFGDPYANIPTEIIDVDYTSGFRSSGGKASKPQVKVTSHSEQSGISTIPIVKTETSVVTMKPVHTVITRLYDSSKGDTPIVKVENVDDDQTHHETHQILRSDKVDEVQNVDEDENEDEEPTDVSSWFK